MPGLRARPRALPWATLLRPVRAESSTFGDRRAGDSLQLHRIIIKRHRIDLLEQRPKIILDLRIVRGMDNELAAIDDFSDVAVLDNYFATLDHVARITELQLAVGL